MRAFLALFVSFSALAASVFVPYAFAQMAIKASQEAVVDHLEGWKFAKNDWIVANVAENTLQFVREDYSAMSPKIRIGSGKVLPDGKKFYYMGLSYDPRTPAKVWEIRAAQQQNWFNVFGDKKTKDQLFLRLFEVKGEQRIWTHYGIHTTPEIDTIIDRDAGFGSWGCLLARYDLLKQIEELYELNDNKVRVVTTTQDTTEIIALLKAF